MPFEPGNNLQASRKEFKGGRPTRRERRAKETASQRAIKYLEQNVDKVMGAYLSMALADPATTRHAVDKFIPPIQKIQAQVEEAPRDKVLLAQVRRTPEGRAAIRELIRHMREAARPAIDVTPSTED